MKSVYGRVTGTGTRPALRGVQGFLWLALMVPLLAACGEQPTAWQGSTAYTLEERAQIQEALDFVCAHTARQCDPIEWNLDPAERRWGIIKAPPIKPGSIATYDGKIFLPELPNMRRAAAHEFAHWRGLGHLPEGEIGLMAPADDRTNDLVWTDADERECQRVRCRED